MPKGIFKRTKSHNESIKKALTGKKRPPFSKDWKDKIGKANKGKHEFWLGKHMSEATKRKIRKTNKRIGKKPPIYFGKEHWNWQGGKSFEPYSVDWTETLKRSIRERDHYICQLCNEYGNCVHHIDYDKKNCNPENLITLCEKCHNRTNYNRKDWTNYFYGKQRIKKSL